MDLVLLVLGAVLVIEGLPYLAFPGKVRGWSLALQAAPDRPMRIIGAVAVLLGAAVILAARLL